MKAAKLVQVLLLASVQAAMMDIITHLVTALVTHSDYLNHLGLPMNENATPLARLVMDQTLMIA